MRRARAFGVKDKPQHVRARFGGAYRIFKIGEAAYFYPRHVIFLI